MRARTHALAFLVGCGIAIALIAILGDNQELDSIEEHYESIAEEVETVKPEVKASTSSKRKRTGANGGGWQGRGIVRDLEVKPTKERNWQKAAEVLSALALKSETMELKAGDKKRLSKAVGDVMVDPEVREYNDIDSL